MYIKNHENFRVLREVQQRARYMFSLHCVLCNLWMRFVTLITDYIGGHCSLSFIAEFC